MCAVFCMKKFFRPVSYLVWSADKLEFPKFAQVKEITLAINLLGRSYNFFFFLLEEVVPIAKLFNFFMYVSLFKYLFI